MAGVLFQVQAVRRVVAVVVTGEGKTVCVTGEGAVEFGIHTAEDALVTDAAAEGAVFAHVVLPFDAYFSAVGVVAGTVDGLSQAAGAFFCVGTLIGVGIG